jgi:squalene synthase HpnD
MMAHADKAASGAIGRSTPLGVARQDLDAVETIVRAAGTSFYHGMRMLPPDRRHAMYAIYAFCRIVDDIADEDGSLEEKRLGLAVWRDNIARLYQGRTEGPVTRVLAAAVPRFQLRADDFIAVIDGMQTDAETVVVAPDMATLDLYCDRVASAVGRLSVRTFGDASPAADQVAHALGRALQLTNILRDIEEDAQRGRIYLPLEYLRDAGVLADPVAILTAPGLPAVCDRLATLAHGYFRQARDAMDQCDPAAMKPARLMAATYDSILSVLERRGWKRLNERVSLPRWKKLWLACRYGLF